MPLRWENVQVPIGAGLDQKTDQRLLPPGKVTDVVNGVFTKLGTVSPRPGYGTFATGSLKQTISGSSVYFGASPPMQQLADFRNELVGIDKDGAQLWTLAETADIFSQQDRVPPCSARRETIAAAPTSIPNPDICFINGYFVVTWLAYATISSGVFAFNGTVMVTVIDAETRVTLLKPTPIAYRATSPRLQVVDQNVVISYITLDAADTVATYAYQVLSGVGSSVVPTFHGPYNPLTYNPTIGLGLSYDVCADLTANTGSPAVLYVTANSGSHMAVQLTAIDPAVAVAGGPNGGRLASTQVDLDGAGVFTSCSVDCADDGGATALVVAHSYQRTIASSNRIRVVTATYSYGGALAVNATAVTIYNQSSFSGNGFSLFTGVAFRPDTDPPTAAVVTFMNAINVVGPTRNPTLGEDQAQAIAQLVNVDFGANTITVTAPKRQNWWVGTLAKPFWIADETVPFGYRAYSWGYIAWPLQGTEFLFELGVHDTLNQYRQWRPVSTLAPRLASSLESGQTNVVFINWGMQISPPCTDGTNRYYTLGVVDEEAGDNSRIGLQLVTFDFNPLTQYQATQLGQNLHFSAGSPFYYDGVNTGEVGFHYYPPMKSSYFLVSGGLGAMAQGTYQYAVTWEWVDSQGQVHQSAPSVQQSVTTTGVGNVNSVEIWIPNLTVTTRNVVPIMSQSNFPQAVIWRSTVGGTILHRLTPEITPEALVATPISASLLYLDSANDGNNTNGLSTKQVLYTAGGVLANFQPPTSRLATSHVQRLWLSGQDNPKSIWYSQQVTEGAAISFNDGLSFTVDDGADITAIAGMDDVLVVFKSDRLFYVKGEGPNSLGQQNDLSPAIPIPSDVGCINPRSVVLTPDGLMFQSEVGITLLTRALEVRSDVGLPVTDYLAQYPNITSAVMHPDMTQVRFTCLRANLSSGSSFASEYNPGIIIIYDYIAKAWTIEQVSDPLHAFTGSGATSAVTHQGTYKMAMATGLLQSGTQGVFMAEDERQVSGSFSDGGIYVNQSLTTSWVSTNDIQGFQRVKRIQVLGQAHDACDVSISYATDYNSTFSAPVTFKVTQPTENLSLQVHVGNQKCEAIRVKIDVTTPTGAALTTGQGVTLTRVGLIAGTKDGMLKLPPAQRG